MSVGPREDGPPEGEEKRPPPPHAVVTAARRRRVREMRRSARTSRPTTTRGTRTASPNRMRDRASSTRLKIGLASPAVKVVDAARRADLAAWGMRAAGAPTAVPRARATRGSETVPRTEAASKAPAAGPRGAPRAAEAWAPD